MSQLLFNPIKNRWFNTYDSPSEKSQVFKYQYADMDDPTYLTFKIEFGDWGASVLTRNALKLGVTSFRAYKSDFDALPIGLLNCPAPGDDDQHYWQTNANRDASVFNNADIYSAFAYLRSRNEDTRAEYLYYFVNGLLEIQRETPYLFKKIAGIEQLEQFDPASGQRLKSPAKITLECYEGLNLKIRTLMEMYRKAAWDDVYQRWILPQNMREFKMIIYVFERRTFQEENINCDLPVKAYECCPCEFDIQSTYRGEYDNAFNQGGEEMTTISISVKNVKTYFTNGLLEPTLDLMYQNNGATVSQDLNKKIDTLMIYDLVETVERQSNIYANSEADSASSSIRNTTINGARALFLNKNILSENEDASPFVHKTGWRFTLVQGLVYDKGKTFWSNVGDNVMNVLTGARRWILASEGSDITAEGKWNNIMNYLLPPSDMELPVSWAADGPLQQMYTPYDDGTRRIVRHAMLHNHPRVRNIDNSDMIQLEEPRETEEQQMLGMEEPRQPDNQQILGMEEPRDVEEQQLLEMEEPRVAEELQILGMEEPRNIDDQSLLGMEEPRQVDTLQLLEMEEPREITLAQFLEMEEPREMTEQKYAKMFDPREIIEQKYIEMNPERVPDNLPYSKLNDPREYAELQYAKLNTPRKTIDTIDKLELIARHIPEFKDFKMEDYRMLKPEEMRNLSDIVARLIPVFTSDRDMLEGRIRDAKTEIQKGFTDADNNQKKIESDSINALKKNVALMSLENTNTNDELAKKRQKIKDFTEEVANNSDKIKSDMVDSILRLKDKLRDLTLESVRKLPETDIMSLKPDETEVRSQVMMSIEDIKQIENNIKLIGLQDEDIRQLSFQAITNLQNEIEANVTVTNNMIGLTDAIEREVSNNINQDKPEERKKLGGNMMNIDEKERQVNRDTIVY